MSLTKVSNSIVFAFSENVRPSTSVQGRCFQIWGEHFITLLYNYRAIKEWFKESCLEYGIWNREHEWENGSQRRAKIILLSRIRRAVGEQWYSHSLQPLKGNPGTVWYFDSKFQIKHQRLIFFDHVNVKINQALKIYKLSM